MISGFLVLGQLKYFWGKSLFGNVSTMHQSRHDHGPRRPHSPPSRDTRHTWTEFKTSERVTGKRGLFLDDVGVSGAPATKGPQRTTSRLCTELESLYRVHCQGENTVPREHATRILLQVTDERVPMQGSPASVALSPQPQTQTPAGDPELQENRHRSNVASSAGRGQVAVVGAYGFSSRLQLDSLSGHT